MAHPDTHSTCDPDVCFAAKCAYWRDRGGVPMKFTFGKSDFHGPTIKERQDNIVRGARANGLDPVLKTTVYTGR